MALCTKCGTQAPDGVQFCPTCGQTLGVAPAQQQYPPQQQYQQPPPPPQQQYQPPQQQYPPPPPPPPQQQPPGYTPPPQQQYQQQQYQQPGYPPPPPGYYPPVVPGAPPQNAVQDAQANKTMGVLAYIIFFIPLITGDHKKSPFVKFHTNQGTVLALASIAYSIISGILSAVIKVRSPGYLGLYAYSHTPGWLSTILLLGSLAFVALVVIGIINAVNGRTNPLPVIGNITIIK